MSQPAPKLGEPLPSFYEPAPEPWYSKAYSNYGVALAVLTAFFIPIKLSYSYCALVPLTLLWLTSLRGKKLSVQFNSRHPATILLFFIACAAGCSLFGLDPQRSIRQIFSLFFFAFSIFVFEDVASRGATLKILSALILGQSLAALHSVLDGPFPNITGAILNGKLTGKVAESGQLGLVLMVVFGLGLLFIFKRAGQNHEDKIAQVPMKAVPKIPVSIGLINTTLFTICAFSTYFDRDVSGFLLSAEPLLLLLSLISILSCLGWAVYLHRKGAKSERNSLLLFALGVPVLTAALLINLKRGPWVGVTIGSIVLGALYARKLLLPLLASIAILCATVPPLQARLAESSQNFFIPGGRNIIWQIGLELSSRYPLGVGYKNSPFLGNFSPEIPKELRHFHNNFLNIVVENGWISLCIYLWWIFLILHGSFRRDGNFQNNLLRAAIGCAILSWQIAGFVEYNFGDSEVMVVAFMLLGIFAYLSRPLSKKEVLL